LSGSFVGVLTHLFADAALDRETGTCSWNKLSAYSRKFAVYTSKHAVNREQASSSPVILRQTLYEHGGWGGKNTVNRLRQSDWIIWWNEPPMSLTQQFDRCAHIRC
jgi:hypothetical protein